MSEEDRARFRRQAAREGKSLGAWLREAASEKLTAAREVRRIESTEELVRFFEACDARETEREPDWESHLRVLARSRSQDIDPT